mgnify:CR=1 FL=1
MKKKIKKVKKCLLCKGSNLVSLFNVGNLYVSNFVKKKDIKNGVKSPLNLLYCKSCTLIQLSHIAPQELMYRRFYWYKSGVTKIMKDALKNIYTESLKHIKLNKKDVVLDIGANDGTLLKYYKKNKFITIAEALKIPRLLESSPHFPAAQVHGKNAYDFYFQVHFEKFFKFLNKR